jgi:Arc-like DNA binding domain
MAHKATELRPIMTRIPERLRRRLERAAQHNDRSMNAEISFRLEKSFSIDDAFGGPELRQIATLMAASFNYAGWVSSGGKAPGDWIKDPINYGSAIVGTVKALLIGLPNATPADVALLFERVRMQVATEFANRPAGAESSP